MNRLYLIFFILMIASCDSEVELTSSDEKCSIEDIRRNGWDISNIDSIEGIKNFEDVSGCEIEGCAEGYSLDAFGKRCVETIISCPIENGIGTQEWQIDSYSNCILESCNEKYESNGNICEEIACLVSDVENSTSVEGTLVSGCEATACEFGFFLEDSICKELNCQETYQYIDGNVCSYFDITNPEFSFVKDYTNQIANDISIGNTGLAQEMAFFLDSSCENNVSEYGEIVDSLEINSDEGEQSFYVKYRNGDKFSSCIGDSIIYDITPPEITINYPSQGMNLAGDNLEIKGSCSEYSTIMIEEDEVVCEENFIHNVDISEKVDSFHIELIAEDRAKNISELELNLNKIECSEFQNTVVNSCEYKDIENAEILFIKSYTNQLENEVDMGETTNAQVVEFFEDSSCTELISSHELDSFLNQVMLPDNGDGEQLIYAQYQNGTKSSSCLSLSIDLNREPPNLSWIKNQPIEDSLVSGFEENFDIEIESDKLIEFVILKEEEIILNTEDSRVLFESEIPSEDNSEVIYNIVGTDIYGNESNLEVGPLFRVPFEVEENFSADFESYLETSFPEMETQVNFLTNRPSLVTVKYNEETIHESTVYSETISYDYTLLGDEANPSSLEFIFHDEFNNERIINVGPFNPPIFEAFFDFSEEFLTGVEEGFDEDSTDIKICSNKDSFEYEIITNGDFVYEEGTQDGCLITEIPISGNEADPYISVVANITDLNGNERNLVVPDITMKPWEASLETDSFTDLGLEEGFSREETPIDIFINSNRDFSINIEGVDEYESNSLNTNYSFSIDRFFDQEGLDVVATLDDNYGNTRILEIGPFFRKPFEVDFYDQDCSCENVSDEINNGFDSSNGSFSLKVNNPVSYVAKVDGVEIDSGNSSNEIITVPVDIPGEDNSSVVVSVDMTDELGVVHSIETPPLFRKAFSFNFSSASLNLLNNGFEELNPSISFNSNREANIFITGPSSIEESISSSPLELSIPGVYEERESLNIQAIDSYGNERNISAEVFMKDLEISIVTDTSVAQSPPYELEFANNVPYSQIEIINNADDSVIANDSDLIDENTIEIPMSEDLNISVKTLDSFGNLKETVNLSNNLVYDFDILGVFIVREPTEGAYFDEGNLCSSIAIDSGTTGTFWTEATLFLNNSLYDKGWGIYWFNSEIIGTQGSGFGPDIYNDGNYTYYKGNFVKNCSTTDSFGGGVTARVDYVLYEVYRIEN